MSYIVPKSPTVFNICCPACLHQSITGSSMFLPGPLTTYMRHLNINTGHANIYVVSLNLLLKSVSLHDSLPSSSRRLHTIVAAIPLTWLNLLYLSGSLPQEDSHPGYAGSQQHQNLTSAAISEYSPMQLTIFMLFVSVYIMSLYLMCAVEINYYYYYRYMTYDMWAVLYI